VDHLDGLNPEQRDAVVHGGGPLLVIAGAGSGKTNTLAHRVAHLILSGADPRRILLLTFTRRAAAEMTLRAQRIIGRTEAKAQTVGWSGTFHAVANRILRLHAVEIGLDPSFTVLDRSDSADLIDFLREERGLAKNDRRFPRKATCLAIYSRVVNAQEPLQRALETSYPWCQEWHDQLRALFGAYVESKQKHHVLDYDDLLLYWHHLMSERALAERVRRRFDHVLVDEFQDTNTLQAQILYALAPDGTGLTVVGDDAQAIYSFRAANVRNILDFPSQFTPPARVVTLDRNYRSTQPILDAANAVIGLAKERFTKDLRSTRHSDDKPRLVAAVDEEAQVDYVVTRVLEAREAGVPLKRQAVLFRAAHHSDALEVELSRRNIPFVKYGGLKFLEAAHVKDTMSVLRFGENLRDEVAAFRVMQLLPGVGPKAARRLSSELGAQQWEVEALASLSPPSAARRDWLPLCELIEGLRRADSAWAGQLGLVRRWYQPHLERLYDHARERMQDLDHLEQIAAHYPSRERFLTELTLDPPSATGADAGEPLLDEDYLILSTIHSAKGQEWDNVFVLNATDGAIPSDMATSTPAELEEERRLLYVAMTRARDALHVIHPQRYFVHQQRRYGDTHLYAPRSRFLPDELLPRFTRVAHGTTVASDGDPVGEPSPRVDVAARLKSMWSG
jgi:DNA helicase-2/ATP-dependent DNA helicase PcrA